MQHVIPNTQQQKEIIDIFSAHCSHKNVRILPNGIVVHQRNNSGSCILGFVASIDGWLTAYQIKITDHSIIWKDRVKPPLSALDEIKARLSALEAKS